LFKDINSLGKVSQKTVKILYEFKLNDERCDALIRAIIIVFAMLLLSSCLNKPNQTSHRDGTEQMALLGVPFWVEDRDGTHTELIYAGRSDSEVVIILSEKVGNSTPTKKQYKFDLSKSNLVTVDSYRLKILIAYEADMMFRFVVN
jgi:hypothetical protein